jgi:hydroxypyruvate isomerase
MAEFKVPVVIEVILERVTNISMGTEIDAINEFEELAESPADAPTAIGLLGLKLPSRTATPDRITTMPKFAANLTMLFNEVPFLDRFERAAKAGFKAVEFSSRTRSPAAEIKSRLQANGLQLVLHNLPAGNWDGGERGIACLPDRVGEFRDGVARAIEYGTALGAPQLNCLAGKAPPAATTRRCASTSSATCVRRRRAEEGRAEAADRADQHLRHPGFYLNRTAQALAILDEVGADNAFVQYDIYHAQRMEGELARDACRSTWRASRTAARRQPGPQRAGHRRDQLRLPVRAPRPHRLRGWIGCEYKPATRHRGRPGLAPAARAVRRLPTDNDTT